MSDNTGTLKFLEPKKGHIYSNGKYVRFQSTFNYTRIKRKIRRRNKNVKSQNS